MALSRITEALCEALTPEAALALCDAPPLGGAPAALDARGFLVVWESSPDLSGFGVRFSPSGRRSFICRYWDGRRSVWITLGKYPRLKLMEARDRATEILWQVADGGDPAGEKRKRANLLAAAAERWLKSLSSRRGHRGTRLSARTIEAYRSALRSQILPTLGDRPVSEIKPDEIKNLHRRITDLGAPVAANRCVHVLNSLYRWLKERGESDRNPAADCRTYLNPERNRGADVAVCLSPEQEARLVAAILDYPDPYWSAFFLAVLDTGRRAQELLALTWDRLDLDCASANLGTTKARAQDSCRLSPRVVEAFRALPRIVGVPWVFPSKANPGERLKAYTYPWEKIKRAAGLEDPFGDGRFRVHDLRHSRTTQWVADGHCLTLVGKQLGITAGGAEWYSHVPTDVTPHDLKALFRKGS